MDDYKKLALFGVALVAILWYLSRAEKKTVIVDADNTAEKTPAVDPIQYPHGITPSNTAHFGGGGEPFSSTVNVYVDAMAGSGLASQFMPMYGFVGMVGGF